jgi:class 3 adenylate cyclase
MAASSPNIWATACSCAERAIRAGLSLEAVPKLATNAGSPLQVRVGIATSLVVVGDLIGAGATQEQAVVGETPYLAARLQALAEPGTVVIASSTRRLIGGLYEYRDLGSVPLHTRASAGACWRRRCWARAPPRAGSRRCAPLRLSCRPRRRDRAADAPPASGQTR